MRSNAVLQMPDDNGPMKCECCDHENDRTAKTCARCDAPLSATELSKLPIEKRLAMLETILLDIYSKVALAGMILLSLEADGYDTSKLRRRPIVQSVRDVAKGFLVKEAFAAYYGKQRILGYFTALPREEQQRLVKEEVVPVCDISNGKTEHRMIEIAELTPQEARLVFDKTNHKVRTIAEQAHQLSAKRIKTFMTPVKISHDPDTGIMNCVGASGAQLLAYIKKHGLE